MALRIFKPLIPESLFGRFLLIIILPMVFVQLIATYIFYERHWNSVSRHMTTALAGEIALSTKMLISNQPALYPSLLTDINESLYILVEYNDTKKIPPETALPSSKELLLLHQELTLLLNTPFTVNYTNDTNDLLITVQLPKGSLYITATAKRLKNQTTYIFILWMTGTAALLLIIAILFSKNQIRSITRLASVAEKFGRGLEITDFKPEGAKEVQQAARAFIRMKERIKRQVTKRTEMLAGVSHDLRTPLTRMKLQLAMMEQTEEAQALHGDIVEMEKMIQEYLDFVRGEGTEPAQPLQLKSLLNEITSSYGSRSTQIALTIPKDDVTITLRKQAIKRAIINLCDNGLHHAEHIFLSTTITAENLSIIIEDDGNGIPEDKYNSVFKPFFRLDNSRNLNSGGVGLGMTIARDIINSHGGTIILGKSSHGGLTATINLPL